MGDDRGSLVAIESEKDVPFSIERVYYIFGTKEGVERGAHAHKNLRQLAIAVRGSCTMVLDDCREKTENQPNDPTQGQLIGSNKIALFCYLSFILIFFIISCVNISSLIRI